MEQLHKLNEESSSELTHLVATAMDLGEQLLMSGGEVARVEDTMRRLCHAYGADSVDVLTITSSIILTANFPGKGSVTQTESNRTYAAL